MLLVEELCVHGLLWELRDGPDSPAPPLPWPADPHGLFYELVQNDWMCAGIGI